MKQPSATLRPGDLVEVKTPEEILQTLDAEGAFDRLPFMPEMLEFCGRRFQISRRAEMTCASGMKSPRGFKANDVVTLDGVRCTGAAHDGCQKACLIFWRQAWLRKVENAAIQSKADLAGSERLQARLKISTDRETYFCQASELAKVTYVLSRWEKSRKMLSADYARATSAPGKWRRAFGYGCSGKSAGSFWACTRGEATSLRRRRP